MFSSECVFFSADDMKVKMGPALAVSRYHSMHGFFMQSDTPNLRDHDFPNPGYLVCLFRLSIAVFSGTVDEMLEEHTSIVNDDWANMESANDIPGQEA